MPDASELFEPLENIIRDQLIPALVGLEVSDAERQILALPLRHGGLSLTDPRETAKMEYEHSTQITLKSLILTTTPRISSSPDTQKTEYDKRKMKNAKTAVMNFWRK